MWLRSLEKLAWDAPTGADLALAVQFPGGPLVSSIAACETHGTPSEPKAFGPSRDIAVLGSVVLYLYSIMAASSGWRLYLGDNELVGVFADQSQAERRARFLAARAAVRGFESEILVYGVDGLLRGRWRAERFEPALTRQAA